jgi:hypothetical protein
LELLVLTNNKLKTNGKEGERDYQASYLVEILCPQGIIHDHVNIPVSTHAILVYIFRVT